MAVLAFSACFQHLLSEATICRTAFKLCFNSALRRYTQADTLQVRADDGDQRVAQLTEDLKVAQERERTAAAAAVAARRTPGSGGDGGRGGVGDGGGSVSVGQGLTLVHLSSHSSTSQTNLSRF